MECFGCVVKAYCVHVHINYMYICLPGSCLVYYGCQLRHHSNRQVVYMGSIYELFLVSLHVHVHVWVYMYMYVTG